MLRCALRRKLKASTHECDTPPSRAKQQLIDCLPSNWPPQYLSAACPVASIIREPRSGQRAIQQAINHLLTSLIYTCFLILKKLPSNQLIILIITFAFCFALLLQPGFLREHLKHLALLCLQRRKQLSNLQQVYLFTRISIIKTRLTFVALYHKCQFINFSFMLLQFLCSN